ncbi:phosphonate ABC transporter substrate-binding protein [Nocardia mangyaensis]|uniref:Phosphonate ABC transporter substrate-binding protein n=1 Tax=Nocardia mangyaensis TaxID=2213200 RepID=A0A1J0VNF7_9NOCA|nr:phosphate/phosphite/phosphonate ABC transporter substrate-binding protein [Nocardia mangyaensis]APE33568.1 phosphonate ABC transporter substrate-binding protein [Nocardia mangyaensis]
MWPRRSVLGVGISVAALSIATLTGCGKPDSAENAGNTVRFAVTDLQGLEELQREFGTFTDVLERTTGLDIELFAVTNRTAAAAALQANRVDIVFTGPAEYVVIHQRTQAEPVVAIERDGYRSCLYTSTDSGVTTVSQLRDKSVAMSDIGSTSGHLGPSQLLVDAGLQPRTDVEVLTVGDAVHAALERGDVAAVGVGCHDYAEYMETDDPAKYLVLQEGPVLPADVIMARAGLDPQVREKIKTAFTEHFDELLPAMLEGKDNAKYENATVVEVTDGDYDVVRRMYRAIGVEDFTEFVGN